MNLFSFVKRHLSIVDVVGEYTRLKKAGTYWKGHCPFHNEKTASFTVSPDKGIFYCFGCHVGGDVINFIATIENYSQSDAAYHLAEQYQIDLPEEISSRPTTHKHEQQRHTDLCESVSRWMHKNLLSSPSTLSYLYKRGFNKKDIQYFELGFFPNGYQAVTRLLSHIQKNGFIADSLIKAHIVMQGKKQLYSPFEGRIIFPIKDQIGRHCGFGGRIFAEHDTRAKYYNSRETTYFSKRSLLFGLDLAKKSMHTQQEAFLVEGYTDCIAMVHHGYKNTVATLGTSCTQEHLTLLARSIHTLYILYDSDKAGKEAVIRLTKLCWMVSIELKVITLPTGEDPASYLQKHESLTMLQETAQDIFSFFIEAVRDDFSSKPLSEKMNLIRELIDTIHTLDDPLKVALLMQKTSERLAIPLSSLQKEYRSTKKQTRTTEQTTNTHKEPEPIAQQNSVGVLEKELFFAIMQDMRLLNETSGYYLVSYLPEPLQSILKHVLNVKQQKNSVDFIHVYDTLTPEHQQYITKAMLEADGFSCTEKQFESLLLQFQKKHWKRIVGGIKKRLERARRESNQEQIHAILRDFSTLKSKLLNDNPLLKGR